MHGPKNGAEPGSRIVLADGDQKLFNECLICLQAIGTHVLFFGKSGSAAGMFLVLQMMFGISTAALAEGMALGNPNEPIYNGTSIKAFFFLTNSYKIRFIV